MGANMTKYIFVTGGVVSGLGKGIAAASLGLLLKSRGFKVINQKLDPYLNINPSNLNPIEHGEIYITDDGYQTDLDLGHYERFTDVSLSKYCSTSAGRIYLDILTRELNDGYNGKTVQVIPAVTDEIKEKIYHTAKESKADIIITEIGGTVGDIESLPFIEAIRQIKYEVGYENCAYIHLTLMPFIKKANELKSKPTQHSVKDLQGLGIQPDIIMLRSEVPIDFSTREKIALFCNVKNEHIIQNLNVETIYELPLRFEEEGLGNAVLASLQLKEQEVDLSEWEKLVDKINNRSKEIQISLVGKYVELQDAYLSVVESLIHAGIEKNTKININWIDAKQIKTKEKAKLLLEKSDGIIIPGAYGDNGFKGLLLASEFAREQKIPYFAIGQGMHAFIIEYAQNVLAIKNAASIEVDPKTKSSLFTQVNNTSDTKYSRAGALSCKIQNKSIASKAYEAEEIFERHRHSYELSLNEKKLFQNTELQITGYNEDLDFVQIVELSQKTHPWMLGVQFHPEYLSRPNKAHPLFADFIQTILKNKGKK